MERQGSVLLAAIIIGLFAAAFNLHNVFVVACRATTTLHTAADNLGRPYQTEYKDSGEWRVSVRGMF